MPGGDGTGPQGLGAMTGRAAGYCAGYPAPGYMNPTFGRGRGGFGYGRGWGRGRGGFGYGRGYGRGFGWGRGFAYTGPVHPYAGYPYPAEMSPQQEADMLKEQVSAIKEEMELLNKHIKELETAEKNK